MIKIFEGCKKCCSSASNFVGKNSYSTDMLLNTQRSYGDLIVVFMFRQSSENTKPIILLSFF